jgi:RNA polymerase sigma-70 factor (ECF subfamily)
MMKGIGQGRLADAELLAAYRREPASVSGRRAISELFGRYRMALYRWCFRYVNNHEAALDLAQETLMEAFRALPRYEGRAQFSSWLFAIARYRCISAIRAPKLLVDDESDPDEVASDRPDPEMEALTGMEEERTLALLNRALDPIERQAVWLRCYEGMPVPEITRVLGVADRSGARGLLQRARRKLRLALAELAGDRQGEER